MNRNLRLTQYLAFVGLGFTQCIMGPLLPAIRVRVAMSDWQAGLVGSGQFIGVLAVGLLGGRLADRFGKKAFVVTASLVMIAGLAGYFVAAGFTSLFLSSVLAGLGGGGYEVGVNALQADHAAEDSGHAMNFLHAFYGVGAVGGPFAATLSLGAGLGWRPVLFLAALAPAAVAALLLAQHVPPGRSAVTEAEPFTVRPVLWLAGLAFALYVGVEMSVSVWITTLWSRTAAGSPIPAPLMSAVFWGALTAGRLVCGKVADRIGHQRFLSLAAAAVVAIGLAWLLFPAAAAMTLAATILFGLALAGIYPTLMALVTDAFPGASGRVVGFLSVFVAVGGFAFPAGVGRLSDARSITVLPAVVVLASVLLLGTFRALRLPRAGGEARAEGFRA
jgi:fucose permease